MSKRSYINADGSVKAEIVKQQVKLAASAKTQGVDAQQVESLMAQVMEQGD